MQVTDVLVRKVSNGSSSFLGYVDVEFDGVLTCKGWRLFKGREGHKYRLAVPAEKADEGMKDKNGYQKYWDKVFINLKQSDGKELLRAIETAVFSKYETAGDNPMRQQQQFSDDAPF